MIFGVSSMVRINGTIYGCYVRDNGDIYRFPVKHDKFAKACMQRFYKDVSLAEDLQNVFVRHRSELEELSRLEPPDRTGLDIPNPTIDAFHFGSYHFPVNCATRDGSEYEEKLFGIYDAFFIVLLRHSLDFLFPSYVLYNGSERLENFPLCGDIFEHDGFLLCCDEGLLPYPWEQMLKMGNVSSEEAGTIIAEREDYQLHWEQEKEEAGLYIRHPKWR